MKKNVVLVGHCGADASYLRLAVMKADREASVVHADDETALERSLQGGVDLLLMNRQLDWGFEETEGVALIRRLRGRFPGMKMMLISNFNDAQRDAAAVGALPGFGKRDLATPRALEVIKSALEA